MAIESVHDLFDHNHITTMQIYDKRRRSMRDSASHKVPIWRVSIRVTGLQLRFQMRSTSFNV